MQGAGVQPLLLHRVAGPMTDDEVSGLLAAMEGLSGPVGKVWIAATPAQMIVQGGRDWRDARMSGYQKALHQGWVPRI